MGSAASTLFAIFSRKHIATTLKTALLTTGAQGAYYAVLAADLKVTIRPMGVGQMGREDNDGIEVIAKPTDRQPATAAA